MATSKNNSTTKSSATQQQTGASNSSFTPNNLAALNTGWNLAQSGLSSNNANAPALINQGQDLLSTGANAATNAATGGLNTATGLANGGTANAANQYLTPFANGSMSTGNPYFANAVNLLGQSLRPQIDGEFAASGRYGSGANANAFASALTNEAGQMAYNNFGQQQQNQLNAAGQLSANNANSTGQRINALDLINGLGTAATNPGAAVSQAGYSPLNNYANILGALGSGGGIQTGTNSQNGTSSGNSNTNGSSFGFDLGSMISPFKLFG